MVLIKGCIIWSFTYLGIKGWGWFGKGIMAEALVPFFLLVDVLQVPGRVRGQNG